MARTIKTELDDTKVINENGNDYTVLQLTNEEIRVRHPKGSDVRFMMGSETRTDADAIFRLASTLTCLSEDELNNLDARDCLKIIKATSSFLE